MPNSEPGPCPTGTGRHADPRSFLGCLRSRQGRKACARAGSVCYFLVCSLVHDAVGVLAGQVEAVMSPFCNPMALVCWGLAGGQHSTGKRSVTSPRWRYRGSPSPTILAVLAWPLCTVPSSFCSGKLCWKSLARRVGQDMGGGPWQTPTSQGWAHLCSRLLAWWEACTVQDRPGQGGSQGAPLLRWRQNERERKGNTKQAEQNKKEGEQEGVRGKEREENETDKNIGRERNRHKGERDHEKGTEGRREVVRDPEGQSQT